MFERLDDATLMLPMRGVEVVLNAVVRAAWQFLSDVGPPVAELLVQIENHLLFLFIDRRLFNERI